MKAKLIVTKGLPASGKTTWARKYVEEHDKVLIVCKDDIRKQLGGKFSKAKEQLVLDIRDTMIREGLLAGYTVISADTNLHEKHPIALREIANTYNAEYEEVDFTNASLTTCIDRDSARGDNSVGRKVITDMYNKYIRPNKKTNEFNPLLYKSCLIVDIDGTVADMTGIRTPLNWKLVARDKPIEKNIAIIKSVANYALRLDTVFVTGRSEECREDTETWLRKYYGEYAELHMKPKDSYERSAKFKERVFHDLKTRYNVYAVFEDSKRCVDMWRSLGLTVMQVADEA